MKRLLLILSILFASVLMVTLGLAESGYLPRPQTPSLWYNEAQVVYLANLEREKAGAPPMRANLQLNQAARWFAWDSVENRSGNFCGHTDTYGNSAGDRARAFGYLGSSGSEDAFCGYVSPEAAVEGWMKSPGHCEIMLDPNHSEAGAGYYRRDRDGRGYVVFNFGVDLAAPPVVINNEALQTPSQDIHLYVHDRVPGNTILGGGPAVEMQVSDDACFRGVNWEPYSARKDWTLPEGDDGWRTVYARTRDAFGRVFSASDMIYYGSGFSPDQISAEVFSTNQPEVSLKGLDSNDLPLMQFSHNWAADDSTGTFELLDGTGERVDDSTALGGTAFRLDPNGSWAWAWTSDFPHDAPMVAYVRVKVDSNFSSNDVFHFSITGSQGLSLRGTDFKAAGEYQEFPLAFMFPKEEDFLTFTISGGGETAVYFDAATFFTAPVAFQTEYTWQVPGGNNRGQAVWVRFTDGEDDFSPFLQVETVYPALDVQPRSVYLLTARDHSAGERATLNLQSKCVLGWRLLSEAPWLEVSADGSRVQIWTHPDGLADGIYQSRIRVLPVEDGVAEIEVPVTMQVIKHVEPVYFPLLP